MKNTCTNRFFPFERLSEGSPGGDKKQENKYEANCHNFHRKHDMKVILINCNTNYQNYNVFANLIT